MQHLSGSDTVCLDQNDLQRKTVLFGNYNLCIFIFNVNFQTSIKLTLSIKPLLTYFTHLLTYLHAYILFLKKSVRDFPTFLESCKLSRLTHSFLDFTRITSERVEFLSPDEGCQMKTDQYSSPSLRRGKK